MTTGKQEGWNNSRDCSQRSKDGFGL